MPLQRAVGLVPVRRGAMNRSQAATLWPVGALAAVLLVFFLAPITVFFGYSFVTFVQPGLVEATPTLENYARLLEDGYGLQVFTTTLRVGVQVTLVCIVVGFPVAVFIARETGWMRRIVLFIVAASLFTNLIVRTYGWIVALSPRGVVNSALIQAGLVEAPLRLMFNEFGVVTGLAQIMLPIFILVVAVGLSTIPSMLEDAAKICGAGPVRTFMQVTLPLSLPGLINGSLLVFVLSISNFITPDFLGGGRVLMVGSLIYQLVSRTLNYPFAAAVGVSMLVLALLLVAVLMLARAVLRRASGVGRLTT